MTMCSLLAMRVNLGLTGREGERRLGEDVADRGAAEGGVELGMDFIL